MAKEGPLSCTMVGRGGGATQVAAKQAVSVTLYWQHDRKGGPTLLASWWEGRAQYTCTVVGRWGGCHSNGNKAGSECHTILAAW
jgi:hypothetical protein